MSHSNSFAEQLEAAGTPRAVKSTFTVRGSFAEWVRMAETPESSGTDLVNLAITAATIRYFAGRTGLQAVLLGGDATPYELPDRPDPDHGEELTQLTAFLTAQNHVYVRTLGEAGVEPHMTLQDGLKILSRAAMVGAGGLEVQENGVGVTEINTLVIPRLPSDLGLLR